MDVEFSLQGAVATVCLNRPEKLNALTPDMLTMLMAHLDRIERDPEIRAVILTGAGRAFCAGADIRGSGAAPPPMSVSHAHQSMAVFQQIALRLYNLDKPVVAAVRGVAVGIAWSYALCADLLLASDTAQFIPAFLMRATLPEGGMVHLLARHCGEFRAKEIMYLNRKLTAQEALACGLANRVVEDDKLMQASEELAAELAAMPTFSIGLTKQLFRSNAGSMEEFLVQELNSVALAVNSEDAAEGRLAAREKRTPTFKGR
ncbi:2-(1,2-epoxy-1,2-dihydrophenyl)acetyl-CoA isomerase [Paraburkholderia sp. BL23I1N1]|uniref:enoyl-CoA hydratase/isomerase family protein n=1 Tax=Paraburkholderia sp. BL23I1N1 TaxID=1938802 RepID=UPI000E760097|nr:enoyl-CoA hydratase/isomerase family protein [Paraburkholderia sp. BL23I1N1]RKE39143.1 2-(1,2-epoxy-1,2-dihydrophenyl)acetyl-CoA isomerase [Paraburkholderia sp. BL23I1N1]